MVELTSGNTGTGLAIVYAIKGYPFAAVKSKGNSMERARMMSALDAGGSFAGCAAAFKEHDPSILCFVVEVAGAAALTGEAVTKPNHRIQGGWYSMPTLPLLGTENIDGYI